jgi:hypothetical protein
LNGAGWLHRPQNPFGGSLDVFGDCLIPVVLGSGYFTAPGTFVAAGGRQLFQLPQSLLSQLSLPRQSDRLDLLHRRLRLMPCDQLERKHEYIASLAVVVRL